VVGRVANRIANGKFSIDGKTYTLAQNNGTNSLHGGLQGYDKVIWNITSSNNDSVTFSYLSKDGEEGFPGDVVVNVTYTLTEDNGLLLSIKGLTSKSTPLNLANHVYFNLAGENTGAKGLGEHVVTMNANKYLPTDDRQIQSGVAEVGGTIFDLRMPSKLSEKLPKCPGGDNNGYDHCFCVNGDPNTFRLMCRVEHKESGRALECHSNQPGVQLYTGNVVPTDDSLKGKNGYVYKKHGGFCLETQTFPDAVNQKFDHDSIIRPGQVYDHQVLYKFFF
jgi:aldose 1-epimerase